MVLELSFLTVVVVDLIEEVCIEVGPFLEGILLTEESWCHVPGDESGLDENGTRAAHRVDKVRIALPTRHQDHACCQHLVEGCLYAFLTVATTVERLPAGIQAEGTVIFGNMYV